MQLSSIPYDLYSVLSRCGLLAPQRCFHNCFLAVMNTLTKDEFDVHYVLGTVTTANGQVFDHAIIKCNGKYHDPTLQPPGLHLSVTYTVEKEFSPDEIMDMLMDAFPMQRIEKMMRGEDVWWPLQRTSPDVYEFVDA